MKFKYIVAIALIGLLSSCGKKVQETKPIRKNITETVFASGNLEAKNTYSLTAEADGYLIEVNYNEGDYVQVGKVLAVIDNKESGFNKESANALFVIAQNNTQSSAPNLMQAQNSITLTTLIMEQDLNLLQRYRKLLEANSISKIDFENIELQYKTSKTNYENAVYNYNQLKQQAEQQLISSKTIKKVNETVLTKNEIRAVEKGKVFKKYKQVGDYVKRGDVIALIGEANNIYAKINVDESNIAKVKIGQEAVIQLNTNKNKTFKGTVTEILPAFNEQSQSFICKINFKDSLDFKIINTQLQVNIITGNTQNALLIPRNYLQYGNLVTIKGEKDPIKITTKFISSDWVQVLSGIDENTVIITDKIK